MIDALRDGRGSTTVRAMAPGKVWLVGAGPGDPALITVRGLAVLRGADVVLHDALSHPALLSECSASAELRDVGKRGGQSNPSQDWITEQLVQLAREGKKVVRLKGGDPMLFARGAEEAEALHAAGVAFEIVPGLSSPVAAAAYAGIPLTHRELSSSVTFITGTDKTGATWSEDAWRHLATATDTLCVLMGMRRIAEITAALVAGGRSASTPAAVIQWGARPEQRVVVSTLARIAEDATSAGLSNPAVIIVGEVVQLRSELAWYDTRPLFGKRLLIPRAPHQAEETATAVRERSAEPVIFPVLEIVDPPDSAPLERAIATLADYDWVVFTSANGVDRFFSALRRSGRDARALGASRVAVIGPKTSAAVERYGIVPDVMAKEFVGEGLAEAILSKGGARRVLVARALVARDALPETLRKSGAHVDVVPVYETKQPPPEQAAALCKLISEGGVDVMLFTSSSTVDGVVSLLGADAAQLLSRVTLASIGPITTDTLRARGLVPAVTAREYTVDGLLDALEEHFTRSGVGA
jgi:uroporphyrinogen III methyltransferase/synthase